MKSIILLSTIILLYSCHGNFFNYNRKDINEYIGKIVIKNHCGFDGLEDSYYILKDINGKVNKVSVEPTMCDIYHAGDTIK